MQVVENCNYHKEDEHDSDVDECPTSLLVGLHSLEIHAEWDQLTASLLKATNQNHSLNQFWNPHHARLIVVGRFGFWNFFFSNWKFLFCKDIAPAHESIETSFA